MAQIIDEVKVMDVCIQEGILVPPDHGSLPDAGEHSDDMAIVQELTEALNNYKQNRTVSNYKEIENVLARKVSSYWLYMDKLLHEFDLGKPRNDRSKNYDIDDIPLAEYEQITEMKSTLNTTKNQSFKDSTIQSTKKTLMQLGGVASAMIGLYAITSNGSLGHDFIMGAVALTGIAVGSAAVLAGKGAKGILKLGAKGVGLGFKAATGTAKKAVAKAERKRTLNAIKQAREGKAITEALLEMAEKDVNDSLVSDEIISRLDEKTVNELQELRNGKIYKIDEFQEELTAKSSEEMKAIRTELQTLKNAKLTTELLKNGLTEEQIMSVLKDTKVNENGELQLPENAGITVQRIEELSLTDLLKQNAKMPKIFELSDAQVLDVAKRLKIENGEISYEQDEKIDDTVKGVLEGLSGEEHYIDNLGSVQGRISENLEQHEITSKVLKEVQARNKLEVCQDLDEQMTIISKEISRLTAQKEISKKDKANRDALRRLAARKVAVLENAGIVETLERGRRREQKVVADAEAILTPDLEKAELIGRRRLDKLADEQEIDEELGG